MAAQNKSVVADFVVYSFVVGGIFVLTSPTGKGPQLVGNLFSGYEGVVQASTGQAVKS